MFIVGCRGGGGNGPSCCGDSGKFVTELVGEDGAEELGVSKILEEPADSGPGTMSG